MICGVPTYCFFTIFKRMSQHTRERHDTIIMVLQYHIIYLSVYDII